MKPDASPEVIAAFYVARRFTKACGSDPSFTKAEKAGELRRPFHHTLREVLSRPIPGPQTTRSCLGSRLPKPDFLFLVLGLLQDDLDGRSRPVISDRRLDVDPLPRKKIRCFDGLVSLANDRIGRDHKRDFVPA